MASLPGPLELDDSLGVPAELTLPLALTAFLRLTPEQLAELCAANSGATVPSW